MKRLVGIFVFVMLIFLSDIEDNSVEAADYYLGVYHNGQEAYLDTSSIRTTNHYTQGYHSGDTYTCIVKAIWSGSDNYDSVRYEVYCGQTVTLLKNGEEVFRTIRAKDPDYLDNNPVENNLVKYFSQLTIQNWDSIPERIK